MKRFLIGLFVFVCVVSLSVSFGFTAGPKRGGTLVIALEGEPANLAGSFMVGTMYDMPGNNLFPGLVRLTLDFKIEPRLAERWTISDDGRTYTFYLNKKAKWHDGKPVTAEDVEYSFNEIICKIQPRARKTYCPNIESAKAVDKHTFVLTLKEPYQDLLRIIGAGGLAFKLLPKHIYAGTDPKKNPANMEPVGFGAFKFKKWVRGSHIELVRNDDFFIKGKPYLDRIIIQFLPDEASRLLAFENGEVDFLHSYILPHDQIARFRKDPRFKIVPHGIDCMAVNEFLLLNHRNQYLKDVRVRRAIFHAIDRKEVQEKSLFGEGKVAKSHINSNIVWCYTDKFDTYQYDVGKANKLLDEAGFRRGSDGKRFSLRISAASGRPFEGRSAEVIRDQLKAVGIDAKVEIFDRATFIERTFRKWDFDMSHQLFVTGPSPSLAVTSRYHTKQIIKAPFVNGMGYSNLELDNIFDTEYKELDAAKRKQMWIRAQEILMRDLPGIPLYEVPNVVAVSAKFNDVVSVSYGYTQSREDAYLAE